MSKSNKAWKNDNQNLINTLLERAKDVPQIDNYYSPKLFDVAIAMYNTFGNIEDKEGLITSMMRSLKEDGLAIISTFSSASIAPRLEMYEMLGYQNLSIEGNTVRTENGVYVTVF